MRIFAREFLNANIDKFYLVRIISKHTRMDGYFFKQGQRAASRELTGKSQDEEMRPEEKFKRQLHTIVIFEQVQSSLDASMLDKNKLYDCKKNIICSISN